MVRESVVKVAMQLATPGGTGGSAELLWETHQKRSLCSLLALRAVVRCWVRNPET